MRIALRAVGIALAVLTVAGAFPAHRVAADPFVTPNGDGTSTAIWDFTTPSDYARSGTAISGGVASLAPESNWWNSSSAADFASPDGETNIDRATWPGDVTLASASGPTTLLTLQPGAAGEDAWLDRSNRGTNWGAATTTVLDGDNPQSRPVLRFDLSAIPAGAVIDGAVLGLYQSAGFGITFTASVYQVTAQWNETQVTWDDRLTGVAWGTAGADWNAHEIARITIDNTAGWRSWNVTQVVDLWYRGRIANYGMILVGSAIGTDSDKTFYSSDYNVDPTRRPRLDVYYRIPGATGEYVSRVGGPGTSALWQTISWNVTERSLVADEFSGASLDPKWTWTNPPASYDVGTTTPGQIRVVSSTAVDFNGATFSGNALANDVVGNFTATIEFTSNPTASGQKAGLMVLLGARDWYAAWKTNVAGAVNWRVRSTADAVSANRVDVASGNPSPAWIRIQRAGTAFSTYTSADGSTWTLRDTYTPTYEYPLSVRLALTFADGGSGTAHAVDVDYVRVTHGADATVAVSTRIGNVVPVDGTWTAWSAPYGSPAGSPMAGTSWFADYRLSFSVQYPDHLPVVGNVNLSWFRYVASGTVETNDLTPANLAAWGALSAIDAPSGQSIAYAYSLDGGGSWTPVSPPGDLSGVSVATGRIRLRAALSTSDTLVTPTVSEIRLTFAHALDHFFVTASANAVAGAPFTVTVTAKDSANATIASWTGAVALAAMLLDGVTPGGGVLGTTSLVVPAGGTASLATETYTKAESILVKASFGTVEGLSAPVVLTPGPLASVVITPPNATLVVAASQAFAGQGYDGYGNPIPGLPYDWTVSGGVGTLNVTTGPDVLLTASATPASGSVDVTSGAQTDSAPVTVTPDAPATIAITPPNAVVAAAGTVPLSAQVYDSLGNPVPGQGYAWSVGGTPGTVNPTTGPSVLFTAGTVVATGNVSVASGPLVAVANITVVPGPPVSVSVTPGSVTLLPFDGQPFSAEAFDAWGNLVPGLSFNWTVVGGVGSLNASTGAGVQFTASPPPANGTVEVAFGAVVGTADVRVVSGVPPWILVSSPAPDAHLTGVVTISYANSADSILATFEYDGGAGWTLIGSTAALNGTYAWDATGLDFVGGRLRATVENNRTIANATIVSPIEVDNTPPSIALGTITDDQGTSGTLTIGYATDADVVRVDFSYFSGAWNAIGSDVTVDGMYVWTPGGPVNGITLRAVAVDDVNLTGTDARAGVGNYTAGVWPPSIAAIPDVHVRSGVLYALNLTFYVADPDTPRAALTLSVSDASNVTANAGEYPSLDILYAAAGTYPVTLWVSDATDTAWTVVRIIASANTPPALVAPVPSVAFDEDTTSWNALGAAATAFFWDPDGDPLAFTLLDGAFVRTRVNGDDTVDLWAQANWSGTEWLRIRATDPTGGFAESAFPVTVRPVNDAPVLATAIPAVAFDEDTVATDALGGNVTLHFLDVDGDALAITVLGGTNVNGAVGPGDLVDLSSAADWSGGETLRVRATDPAGLFAEGSFPVTVRPVNDAPVLAAALPTVAFDEDATALDALAGPATPFFSDVDGDALTFTVPAGVQVSARVNPAGTVDLWAAANWSGAETVPLRATDPAGLFVEAALAVTVRPVNDAPVLAAIPAQAWDEGQTRTLDLTPYVSDIDTALADLVVTTDSARVRVEGLVLTMTFPTDWSEARFTITVSDGDLSDSQPLRVVLIPPWWESPYFLPFPPLSVAVVIGVFAQRARFRPVKAFLVSDDKRLIREFTLDPGCDVTFEQALGAGALDAVEKPVKVARYHAQTVKGDALAVTLLAYGPVSPGHIEFAREMLVNIQDTFDEGVKERHAAVGAREAALATAMAAREAALDAAVAEHQAAAAAANAELEAERQAVSARSRAITDLVETTTVARTRMAEEAHTQHALAAEISEREARVGEDATRAEARAREVEADRAAFAAWKAQAEDELRRTREALDAQAKSFAEQQSALVHQIEEFEASRAQKMEFLASKGVELEAKEQSFEEREATVRSQSEENGRRLAELAAREETLEVEADRVDRARREDEVRRAQLDEAHRSLEAKVAALREDEARKAEEYRQWHATLESQETVLRDQKGAFEAEAAEARDAVAKQRAEIEAREHALVDREAKVRADAEYAARVDADLKRREEAAQLALARANDLTEQADRMRAEATRQSAEIEARERAMQQEADRVAAEAARRAETFKVAEAQLVNWKADLARQFSAREAAMREAEADLGHRRDGLEEQASLLLGREASLSDLQDRLEQERTDLQARTEAVEERGVEMEQLAQRHADAVARFRDQSGASAKALAAREAALKAEQERLERESQSLQDTLGAKAGDLAKREASLETGEADLRSRLDALDAREREVAYREQQASDQIGELSAKASDLEARTAELGARSGQLDAAAKRFAVEEDEKRKQWAEIEAALRGREEQAKAQAEEASAQVQARTVDLDRREKDLQELITKMKAERAQHGKVLMASAAKKAEAEEAAARAEERLAALTAQDSELSRAREAFEAERAVREEKIAARLKDLDARNAQLEAAAKKFALEEDEKRKQRWMLEEALRAREAQAKTDAEATSAQLQVRAVDLDRRERSLQEALAKAEAERAEHGRLLTASAAKKAEAEEAAARAEERLAELNTQESELLRARQAFEAERAAWEPKRSEELRRLEATRQAAADQGIQAERAIAEARKQASAADDAQRNAAARIAEAAAQEAKLAELRAEVERAERELQAQTARMQDASRALANRERDIEAWAKERAIREEKLAARAKELEAATREIESRTSAVGAEASRLMKLDSDLAAKAEELAAAGTSTAARAADLAKREKEVGSREASVRGREGTLSDLEVRLGERDATLAGREAELKGSMESLQQSRAAADEEAARLDQDRKVAGASRQEADAMLEAARKAKSEVDAQQAELAKSMKFLQKKSLEVLDQQERMRKREETIHEKENAIDARSEVVEGEKTVLDRERTEMEAALEEARAEVEGLRAKLATADARAATAAALELEKKDIESRLKIIQKKAMEMLDREERLRQKEDELRAAAERLGPTA